MKDRARRELIRNWPFIGIAVVLWVGVVVLRTPELGINPTRVFAIILTSGAMFVIGMMFERIRKINEDEEPKP